MEIAGRTAIWTRPDSGDCPCSYPAPTYSAVRGIFESVLWGPAVLVIPTRVELCAPIQYHSYATNYGGPIRSGTSIKGGNNYQLFATVARCASSFSTGLFQSTRPPRGAWIETITSASCSAISSRSRPPRGAWIETSDLLCHKLASFRRAPHGARGLKHGLASAGLIALYGRAPHGARGLKLHQNLT